MPRGVIRRTLHERRNAAGMTTGGSPPRFRYSRNRLGSFAQDCKVGIISEEPVPLSPGDLA